MPATSKKPLRRRSPAKARSAPRKAAPKLPPPPQKPATPYPGYMTDEWHEYAMAMLKRVTKEEFLADLVRFGILDKKGRYTKPYRNS